MKISEKMTGRLEDYKVKYYPKIIYGCGSALDLAGEAHDAPKAP